MSYVEVEYQMSERHACRLMGLRRSTHRYRARKAERDAALRTRLKELAAKRMRFGYRRLTAMLVREGMAANHKRVYRLYREEGLAMRRALQLFKSCRGPAPNPSIDTENAPTLTFIFNTPQLAWMKRLRTQHSRRKRKEPD